MPFLRLFEPIQLRGREARNRVMQLATTNNLDDEGRIGPDLVEFYATRARHGVGIVVTEGLGAHHSAHGGRETSLGRSRVAAFDPGLRDELAVLAEAVRAEGALIIGQIFHGGRQHHANRIPMLWGPSAEPCPHSGGIPHEMTHEEIESAIEGFATAAEVLVDAGFDGVEIHGAQGHLIQEFMSGYSNLRTDEYGGSLENRMRFPLEVGHAVRRAVGDGPIVGYRIAGSELSENGIDREGSSEIAVALVEGMDLDYLSVSMGNFNSIEIHTPDRHHEPGEFIDYAGSIREAVAGRVPIIGCGRILTPSQAEDVIAKGHADMVGLCRPLLADERWVEKAKADLEARIRVCISCNQCWGSIIDERRILCIQNAVTGNEREFGGDIPIAGEHKRVVIVGGGPSGMEAARVAAARGHDVILFERSDHLGGSVAVAATIPGHGDIDNVRGFLADEVAANGVEVRLKQDVKLQWVLDELPDAVVIATGSTPRNDLLGAPVDFPVLTSIDVVRDRVPTGGRTVLFDEDGYYQGAEVAEMIARSGTELTVVTRFWEFAREIPATSKVTTMRALDELGVEIVPVTWFSRVEGRSVVLAHYLTGRERIIENVDSIVHVGRADAEDGLYRELKGLVPELYLVGDAYQPRRIHDAVMEGHRVGRAI